jgi:hypothetical protein
MPPIKKVITIHTSDNRGEDYCDPKCEHAVETNRFPQQILCKISGKNLKVDLQGNVSRSVFCRYLCGEEVPDRFYSQLKGES